MAVQDQLKKRIEHLIGEGSDGSWAVADEISLARCRAYVASALAAVEAACQGGHAYVRQAQEIAESAKTSGWVIHERVFDFVELLKRLRADIKDGLLADIESAVLAVVFDDFLDHATAYEKDNRKNEAGVIAGVVFEDTVRRISRKHAITEKGRPLEDVLNDLNKANVLTGTKTKRAKSAAHVRTKATHAQWDEFDMKDVTATIAFTRELIDTQLQA